MVAAELRRDLEGVAKRKLLQMVKLRAVALKAVPSRVASADLKLVLAGVAQDKLLQML